MLAQPIAAASGVRGPSKPRMERGDYGVVLEELGDFEMRCISGGEMTPPRTVTDN